MSEPMPEPTCRDCGAANDPGASECWRCQRRDWRATPGSPVPMKPEPSHDFPRIFPLQILPEYPMPMNPEPSPIYGTGPTLIGQTLALVTLGSQVLWTGLVVIVCLPAVAAAEMIAHLRRRRGLPTSDTRKTVWFVVVLIIIMSIPLGLALFIAFWLIGLLIGLG